VRRQQIFLQVSGKKIIFNKIGKNQQNQCFQKLILSFPLILKLRRGLLAQPNATLVLVVKFPVGV